MLVIDSQRSRGSILDLATAAAAGGVDSIYFRDGDGGYPQATKAPLPEAGRGVGVRVSEEVGVRVSEGSSVNVLATSLRARLDPTVTLLLNQPWQGARHANVGLHLRERDPIPDWTSTHACRPALVERSVHSPESAAASDGVDYLLAGHVFPSASKPGKAPLGLDGLASIIAVAPCPVIAIGGIGAERVAEVLHAGAHGVAVIGAIAEAADPYLATKELRAAIETARSIKREETSVPQTDTKVESGITFEIIVNGKYITVPERSTIHDFLASKRMTGAMAIVERNGEIVPRGEYAATYVTPGDRIEVVHAVGGG